MRRSKTNPPAVNRAVVAARAEGGLAKVRKSALGAGGYNASSSDAVAASRCAPLKAFMLFLVAVCVVGCYHLGPNPPKQYTSLAVPEFKLGPKVLHPRLQTPITGAVIKRLQADNAVSIADSADADAILDGTIVAYDLQPLRFQPGNQAETREYRVVLTAHVIVKNRSTGEVLLEDKRVSGETSFFILGDLTTSERQALPLAADDLARNIVKLVGEGW